MPLTWNDYIVNIRTALGGMWAFFLSVGVVRGLTVLEHHFTVFYGTTSAGFSLLSSLLLIGYLGGGLSAGVIIPKFGVKWPTIISGISCTFGCCLIAMFLEYRSLTMAYIIICILVGSPQGLCINTTICSAQANVKHETMGLVMTLMGGGVSVAALALPKIYKTVFNWAFDMQPVDLIIERANGTLINNHGMTLQDYPFMNESIKYEVCNLYGKEIFNNFKTQNSNLTFTDNKLNCGDLFGHFDNSSIPFDASFYPDENLQFWNLVENKVSYLAENSKNLYLDAQRKALFDYSHEIENYSNLYYPLMVMWYFIGATMTMLILAGVLILERPPIGSKKGRNNSGKNVSGDSSSESETTVYESSNSREGDKTLPHETEIDQSQEEIQPITTNKTHETASKLNARKRVSSRISQRIAESLQMSMPAGYVPNNNLTNLDVTGDDDLESNCDEGPKTFIKEDGSIVEEKVGLFSMKLATQPSFICHSVAQLLFFAGYFCVLPYLDGLLGYFGLPEVERPDFILIMGCVEIASRLWHAFFLVDRFNKLKLISLTYFGDGVGLMICLIGYFYPAQWKVYMILAFVLGGYFNAGFGGLVMACLVEITDVEYFSVACAMQSVSIGLGESIGPLVGGFCNDHFPDGSGYLVAVLVGCVLMMCGGIVAGGMFFAFKKEQKMKRIQEGLTQPSIDQFDEILTESCSRQGLIE